MATGRWQWMQFYPADYLLDTRSLPAFVRGIWMDLICFLWRESSRGIGEYAVQVWAQKCGVSGDEMLQALQHLSDLHICDISGDVRNAQSVVRIENRRMTREQKHRERNRLYQAKHRQKKASKTTIRTQITDNRKQITDNRKKKREFYTVVFEEFWKAYPNRNGKKVGKEKTARLFAFLSADDQQACIEAARHYGRSERACNGYVKDPERFFRDGFWKDWLTPEAVLTAKLNSPTIPAYPPSNDPIGRANWRRAYGDPTKYSAAQ